MFALLRGKWTDEDARAAERIRRSEISTAAGQVVCWGYPLDWTCPVFIPWTKPSGLCHFCERTRALEQARIQQSTVSMAMVGEILALPTPEVINCPCGGDSDAPMHEASLLHVVWSLKQ